MFVQRSGESNLNQGAKNKSKVWRDEDFYLSAINITLTTKTLHIKWINQRNVIYASIDFSLK